MPLLYEAEEGVITAGEGRADKAAVAALLADGTKGSLADKLRLLAIYQVDRRLVELAAAVEW